MLINNAFSFLNIRQKINFFLLVILQLLGIILDILGLGLVLPVMLSINNKVVINNFQSISKYLFKFVENDRLNFLLYMIIGLLIFNFFKIGFLILLNFKKNSYAYNLRLMISSLVFDKVLGEDYSKFIKKNSSEVVRSTLSDVDSYVNQYLIPLSEMLSDLILLFLLVGIALFYNPFLTIILVCILVLFVTLINSKLSSISKFYGEKRVEHYTNSFQFLQEGLGAIKEIKMYDAKLFFVNRFKVNYKLFINYARKHTLLAEIPRFSIELLVFVILFVMVYYFSYYDYSVTNILALIAGFSLLSLRLMPVVNKLQLNYQIIHNNQFLISHLTKIVKENRESVEYKERILFDEVKDISELSENLLQLDQVYYSYNNESKPLINGIFLKISQGEIVGIIGKSGSGKTTLSNILLGLIQPDKGEILYKGVNIESDKYSYVSKVGYVPQFVYLLDDSVVNNIAFGKSNEDIDIVKVNSLIDLLELRELVGQMSNGLNTRLGDRGVTLSGGQIQRFGIARALYINPEILILDESTSALDSETQSMVLDRILDCNPNITIIMITHRIEVLNYCTSTYEIKDGYLNKLNVDII